jgi:class 3 adenylate cyclase
VFFFFPVETIGDAYVACANVVEVGRPEHTKLLVDFALAMQKATKSMFTPVGINGSPTQQIVIRVGIHTGTVIAGVVGRKCPRYHLFGETGQLEQHIHIHITHARYWSTQ